MRKIVDPNGILPDTYTENIDQFNFSPVNYYKVTTWEDGSAMNNDKVDGYYYRKLTDGTYVKAAIPGPLTVEFFGAVGNAYYRNDSGELFADPNKQIHAHDDTVAIQTAINVAVATGKDLLLEQKHYQITNTINIPAASPVKSFHLIGQGTGGFTYLRFRNTIPDKNMFSISTNMTYMVFENIAFRDEIPLTSKKCTYQASFSTTGSAPLWKVEYKNFRFENFKVGLHFLGDANPAQDVYLDGFTFSHGKFRECQTSVIYENTQAVNHTYLNVDFENNSDDDKCKHYKIFHFKRGSTVNHFGGSVIGTGPYVYIEVFNDGGYFQATSQFNSYGVRMEHKLSTIPIIYHAENSSISFSNSFKVNQDGFSVINGLYQGTADLLLAKLGGQIALTCNNVRTSHVMYVYASVTTALAGSAQLGNIDIRNSNTIKYKKYIPTSNEYGAGGVLPADQTEIPARIVNKVEGVSYTLVNGYLSPNNSDTQVLAAGFTPTVVKQLVYKPANVAGYGGGANPATISLILPQYARPFKFGLIKTAANSASAITMTFNIEVGGVQYQCAQINTTGSFGAAEAMLVPPAASLNELYVDGTAWDGKCTIVKSGSVNAFQGVLIIYYI
jgi:hypothetical protein